MIKAIIFDLWETLFFDNINPKPLDEFAKRIGKNFKDCKFLRNFERAFCIKKHRDFKIPIKLILKSLKIKYDENLLNELYEIMKKSDLHHKPFPEVFHVLKELRSKYKIALISNTSYPAYNDLELKYNLNKYFNVILVSYQTKLLKPDSRVFYLALKKLNVKKEEVIMIGDNMRDDIIAAQNFGIKAVLIDRKNKYPKFKRRMSSLNDIFNFLY